MKFPYLWDQFEYCLKKFSYAKRKLEIKPHSTFFFGGTITSHVGAGTISTDCLPPSLSTVPPSPSDAEDHVCTPVHCSHSPNIIQLHFCVDLVVSPSISHVLSFLLTHVFPQMILSCVHPLQTLHLL